MAQHYSGSPNAAEQPYTGGGGRREPSYRVGAVRAAGAVIHLAIAAGGAAGAFVRHGLGTWLAGAGADGLPWGTLLANVCGAFLLGVLMGRLPSSTVSPAVRAGLTIGFCGGFTTFSAFAYETVSLVERGRSPAALAYVAASLTLGMTAMFTGLWAGSALARADFGRRVPSLRRRAPWARPGREDAR